MKMLLIPALLSSLCLTVFSAVLQGADDGLQTHKETLSRVCTPSQNQAVQSAHAQKCSEELLWLIARQPGDADASAAGIFLASAGTNEEVQRVGSAWSEAVSENSKSADVASNAMVFAGMCRTMNRTIPDALLKWATSYGAPPVRQAAPAPAEEFPRCNLPPLVSGSTEVKLDPKIQIEALIIGSHATYGSAWNVYLATDGSIIKRELVRGPFTPNKTVTNRWFADLRFQPVSHQCVASLELHYIFPERPAYPAANRGSK